MDPVVVVPVIALIAGVYLLAPSVLLTIMGTRKPREVTCPDNHKLVKIHLSPGKAAKRLFTDCDHGVNGCTRWPEKAGCDQACTHGVV